MIKVLILAYDFPPYVSVGGLRPYSWYKYFKEFGLYPVVVTRQWGNEYGNHLDYIAPSENKETIIEQTELGTIIRTPYKPNLANRIMLKYGDSKFSFIRKAITAYYEFAQFLFFVGTKSGLYFGAKKYLKENKVDCIIATGEPFVLFKHASKLSSKFNIPWIADYRDPWSQNNVRSSNFFFKTFNQYCEKKFLENVNTITTISIFFKFKISNLLKNKEILIISNGYDPEIAITTPADKQNQKELTISFAGTIYKWHPWQSFLNICNKLYTKDNIRLKINFYGINNKLEVLTYCEEYKLKIIDNISIFPKVPNSQIIGALSKSNLLLLFNDYSIIGTKIYDYLAVKRKILFCYTNDANADELKKNSFVLEDKNWDNKSPQADLINKTKSGFLVENESHLLSLLTELHKEFKETGEIACNSVGIEDYSRKKQVEKLARIIQATL